MPLFEIDIVSEPRFSLHTSSPEHLFNLTNYDENIIKPALLFADRVNLITTREDLKTYLIRDAAEKRNMPLRSITWFLRVAAERDTVYLERLGISPNEIPSRDEIIQWRRDYKRRSVASALDPRSETMKLAAKYGNTLNKAIDGALKYGKFEYDQLSSTPIDEAIKKGLVTVTGWGVPRDIKELVWEDRGNYFDRLPIDALARITNSPRIPLLDPGIHEFSHLYRRHESTRTQLPHHQPLVASKICAQLPGIEHLSIPELIDLRSSLADYLPTFRAEVMKISDEVKSVRLSQDDLTREVEIRWAREIQPAVVEISREIQRASYGREILRAATQDKATLASGTASIALSVGSLFAGLSTFIPAAAAASYTFLKSWNTVLEARDAAKNNSLYFLHAAEQGIRKKNINSQ